MAKETGLERVGSIMLSEFKRVHDRFDIIDTEFSDLRTEVRTIRKQLDELEKASRNFAGFAKEIDHLLGRIAAIEKHLGLHSSITA